jgi:hypothetical protein
MSRSEALIWLLAALLLAVIWVPAISDRKAQPERLQQIEACHASGGTPIVGMGHNGDYIRRVQCAKGRKP